eukprot:6002677-Ditylum_brightwellii.AAC.1
MNSVQQQSSVVTTLHQEHTTGTSFEKEEQQENKEEKKDMMYDDDDQSYDFNKVTLINDDWHGKYHSSSMMIHSALSEEDEYNDNVGSSALGGGDEIVSADMFEEAI